MKSKGERQPEDSPWSHGKYWKDSHIYSPSDFLWKCIYSKGLKEAVFLFLLTLLKVLITVDVAPAEVLCMCYSSLKNKKSNSDINGVVFDLIFFFFYFKYFILFMF